MLLNNDFFLTRSHYTFIFETVHDCVLGNLYCKEEFYATWESFVAISLFYDSLALLLMHIAGQNNSISLNPGVLVVAISYN